MNLVQKIATNIVERIEAAQQFAKDTTGKKLGPKAVNQMNLDLWVGAFTGIAAVEGYTSDNAKWLNRLIAWVITVRGYEETKKLAQMGKDEDAEKAVQDEAAQQLTG